MSNPLSMFRKHQFALMVVLVFISMGAFVVAPSIDEYLRARSGGGPVEDTVVVTYTGGTIRDSEIQRMRQAHNLLILYLRSLVQETQQRNGTPRGVRTNAFGQVVDPGIPSSDNDETLVYTLLLAQKAESMGLVVSNDAMIEFLQQLTGGVIPTREFGAIFSEVLGDRVTEEFLLDQLRTELLAQKMRYTMQAGLFVAPAGAITPGKAWEYFQRLNRRVDAEMIPIPVSSFYDELQLEPTESELQAIFEEGKNRFPMPTSSEPGFRRRRQAAFQFAKVNFDQFLEAEKAKVMETITDEEIEAHYEQNKQKYRVTEPSETPAEGELEGAAESPAAEAPATETPATETPAAETPAAESPAAESPAAETPATPATPAAESTEEEPAADGATPAEPDSAEAPSSDAQSEFGLARLTFVSAQAQETADSPTAESPTAESPTADTNDTSAETPATDDPATETPAAETPAAETPAAETAAPATAAPATAAPATAAPATTDAGVAPFGEAATTDETDDRPIRPLDDTLRQEIREEIADAKGRRQAQERLDAALEQVRKQVEDFDRQRRRRAFDAAAADAPDELAVGDLEHDELVTMDEVPLVNALTVEAYELSKAEEMQFTSWPPQTIQFEDVAFNEGLPTFAPLQMDGEESGVTYLFWKTEEIAPFVPTFDQARDEVLEAWQKQHALELAKQRAEELVGKARNAESLAAVAEGVEELTVLRPPPFSWMSTGFNPGGMGAPALSFVEGLEGIGPDLMRSVFALDVGDVGVAVNQPQTVVYVTRIVGQVPSQQVLRQQFLQSGVTFEIASIANNDAIDLQRAWYFDLDKEMGVVWNEAPPESN